MDDVLKKIEAKEKIKDKKTFNNIKIEKLNESIDIDYSRISITESKSRIQQMESMFANTNIGNT